MEITYFSTIVCSVVLAIVVGSYVADSHAKEDERSVLHPRIELSETPSKPKAARGYTRPANVVQVAFERNGERKARGYNRGKTARPVRTVSSVPSTGAKRARNGSHEIAA